MERINILMILLLVISCLSDPFGSVGEKSKALDPICSEFEIKERIASKDNKWITILGGKKRNYKEMVNPYKIQKYEVTNLDFAEFLNIHGADCGCFKCDYRFDPNNQEFYLSPFEKTFFKLSKIKERWQVNKGFEQHPIVLISWFAAKGYCKALGGDLPSDLQWEYAAIANGPIKDPWPDGPFKGEYANSYKFEPPYDPKPKVTTAKIGSYEMDKSPFGLYDMAGNVSEWSLNTYVAYPRQEPCGWFCDDENENDLVLLDATFGVPYSSYTNDIYLNTPLLNHYSKTCDSCNSCQESEISGELCCNKNVCLRFDHSTTFGHYLIGFRCAAPAGKESDNIPEIIKAEIKDNIKSDTLTISASVKSEVNLTGYCIKGDFYEPVLENPCWKKITSVLNFNGKISHKIDETKQTNELFLWFKDENLYISQSVKLAMPDEIKNFLKID